MSETRLWFLQRLTALVLAPLVIGHLAMIVYAVRGGLSAAEILGRTQGSLGWALFYPARSFSPPPFMARSVSETFFVSGRG